MGNTRLCVCGHNTTDHKYYYNKQILWGSCEWIDCKCKKYTFSHEVSAKYTRPNIIIEDRAE